MAERQFVILEISITCLALSIYCTISLFVLSFKVRILVQSVVLPAKKTVCIGSEDELKNSQLSVSPEVIQVLTLLALTPVGHTSVTALPHDRQHVKLMHRGACEHSRASIFLEITHTSVLYLQTCSTGRTCLRDIL